MTIEELVKIAQYLVEGVDDDRHPRLWGMPSANDPQSLYYRFLRQLARVMKPKFSVEIGTYVATASAHMADGYPDGKVMTIDNDQNAKNNADRLGIPNLIAVHDTSAIAAKLLPLMPPIDILFIDGNHTFNNCYGEYVIYRPFVRDGGVILFDDIDLCKEMEVAWKYIPDQKVSLKKLHYTGFGLAIKTPGVIVRSWDEVAPLAAAEFK